MPAHRAVLDRFETFKAELIGDLHCAEAVCRRLHARMADDALDRYLERLRGRIAQYQQALDILRADAGQ